MTSIIDACLDASHLVTRAAGARGKASGALKMMKKEPKSFAWLRRYVASAAQVEEAELQLLRIKRDLNK